MCGIHAVVQRRDPDTDTDTDNDPEPLEQTDAVLARRLRARGPDLSGRVVIRTRHVTAALTSTVLALRGATTAQPLVDDGPDQAPDRARALCWNGEAWRIDGVAVRGNDGARLFELLLASRDPVDVLRSVEGPFAFAWLDAAAGRLYYGRDRLGRRSLLVRNDGHRLALASVAGDKTNNTHEDDWAEVPADGVHVVDLAAPVLAPQRVDWAPHLPRDAVAGLASFNMDTNVPDGYRLTADAAPVATLDALLRDALVLRLADLPQPPTQSATGARVAVLFSGGLDCSVLARLAHDILPAGQAIDLVNVAFENPRVAAHLPPGTDVFEACPDRATGRAAAAELARVCTSRPWRFAAVNVPYALLQEHRAEIVALMRPHDTAMDLSIASALYFAARADAATHARVLLSGLGADELFGGYGRHAVAYRTQGMAGLCAELRLDVARLAQRNLGRDDRVLTHWGREARFPFLDERLVAWAVQAPVWTKCAFAEAPDGTDPAKKVLRLVAAGLGLERASCEPKRAIQFGARTAKMEAQSGRVKGTASVK